MSSLELFIGSCPLSNVKITPLRRAKEAWLRSSLQKLHDDGIHKENQPAWKLFGAMAHRPAEKLGLHAEVS